MRWGRRVLVIFSVALLAIVAGCATNTAANRTADGLELDLTSGANEGHAILRVIALRPISTINPKWQRVNLTSNGRSDSMADVTAPTNVFFGGRYYATESLYFAKLPAGRYDITGFGSTGPGPGLIPALLGSDSASTSSTPAFSVESGRLANLGTLVFAPEFEKEQAAQMFLLNGPVGREHALNVLLAESGRKALDMPEGGGWATRASTLDEEQTLARARAQVSLMYLRAGDAGVSGGSHLGQVVKRTGPRQWVREPVDTLSTIFSTTSTNDGRVIAGGEYGSYFVRSGLGVWQEHRLPGDKGRVVYLEPRGPSGALIVTTGRTGSRYWVHDSPGDAMAIPREVAKLESAPDLILSTPSELIVPGNIPGILRETDIRRVSKTDFSVTTQRHNFWVLGWQHFPGGEIRMTRQNGVSMYLSKSADAGKSWAHEQTSSGSHYWMDSRRGYRMNFSAGFSTVTNNLLKTNDGGAQWEPVGTPLVTPDFAGSIVYADSTEVVVQVLGQIHSTVDEGKTWVRVFPPVTGSGAPAR